MKKFLIAFAIVPLLIAGCGSGSTDNTGATGGDQATTASTGGDQTGNPSTTPTDPKDQVVGVWKIDFAGSTVPDMKDEDKKEGESVRVTINADGTYSNKMGEQENKGTWTIEGHSVTFKSEGEGRRPPVMTLSDDGTKLTSTEGEGEHAMTIVMVKE
jgi:hypothetical protein